MRLRRVFWTLVVFLSVLPGVACAETTPAEAAAISAAQNDHSAYTLPPDKAVQAESLYRIRALSQIVAPLASIVALFLLLQFGIAARIRDVATRLSKNRWAQGYSFFFLFLLFTTLINLPFDIYAQHMRSNDGLSVQAWGSWFGDQAKSFALLYVFGGLGVMLLFFLIRKFPRRWWLYLWVPAMCVGALALVAGPYVIDPMFNKFEPLSKANPALVERLEQVVVKGNGIQIPSDRMFMMKASDKVTTINAYVTGFGASKRVVIYDTTIVKATPDEILAIFGHEMGHYVLGHIVSDVLSVDVFLLLMFFLGFHLMRLLVRRFGGRWRVPAEGDWAALAIFVMVLSSINFIANPFQHAFFRTQEHAADVYGEEVIHGIVANPQASFQAAMQRVAETNLTTPNPSPLVEFFIGVTPTASFRAAFAKYYNPWTAGAEPKYFPKDSQANSPPDRPETRDK